jgi:hypothetical protein
MKNLNDYLKQLKIDCEKLKERHKTIEAQEEHKNNPTRRKAQLYCYYRNMGCTKEQARTYADWNYKNIVEKPRK